MKTVSEVIAELQALPPEFQCAALEREGCGIVVYDPDGTVVAFVETPLPESVPAAEAST